MPHSIWDPVPKNQINIEKNKIARTDKINLFRLYSKYSPEFLLFLIHFEHVWLLRHRGTSDYNLKEDNPTKRIYKQRTIELGIVADRHVWEAMKVMLSIFLKQDHAEYKRI